MDPPTWKLGASLRTHAFKPSNKPRGAQVAGVNDWFPYSQKMLDQNLKKKGTKKSEIAKVLTDVRALEEKVRVLPRMRDPLLMKKDVIAGVPEPLSWREKRRTWTEGSQLEVLDQRYGRWIEGVVTEVNEVEEDDEGDILTIRMKAQGPLSETNSVKLKRSNQSILRPTSGNKLKKLYNTRQARHDRRLDDYRKARESFEMELQRQVGLLSRSLKSELAKSKKAIAQTLSTLTGDDQAQLGRLTMQDIDDVWTSIDQLYMISSQFTTETIGSMAQLEVDRKETITRYLTSLVRDLVDIAHRLPEQIEQELKADVWQVNTQIVRNCGWHKELAARLEVTALEERLETRKKWRAAKQRWRAFRHEHAILVYKQKMEEPEFRNPPQLRTIFGDFEAAKRRIEAGCVEAAFVILKLEPVPYSIDADNDGAIGKENPLFTQKHHLVPPNVTDREQKIFKLREEFNGDIERCKKRLVDLRNERYNSAKKCLDKLRESLIDIGASEEKKVAEFLETDEFMMPLIEKRKKEAEALYDKTDNALDQHDDFYQKLENICKYFKAIAKHWKEHFSKMHLREVETKEDLFQICDNHNEKLKLGEDSLEKKLEREILLLLREPTLNALDKRMETINDLVGDGGLIEKAHRDFNHKLTKKATDHVPLLSELSKKYESLLAHAVGLAPIDEEKENLEEEGKEGEEAKKEDEKKDGEDGEGGEEEKKEIIEVKVLVQDSEELVPFEGLTPVSGLIQNILTTGTNKGSEGNEDEKNVEEKEEEKKGGDGNNNDENAEGNVQEKADILPRFQDGTPCFEIPQLDNKAIEEQFSKIRSEYLGMLLSIHRTWISAASGIMQGRVESFSALYDQELRKHRPRIVRVEVDKRDYRKDQILANEKRFRRHLKRVDRMVTSQKRKFEGILKFQDPSKANTSRVDTLVELLQGLTSDMLHNDNLSVIQTIYNKGNAAYDELKKQCGNTAKQLASLLDMLQSTADELCKEFLEACKLIDDGKEVGTGNNEVKAATAAAADSSGNENGEESNSHNTYVLKERQFYEEKMKQLMEEYSKVITDLRPNIKELQDQVETLEAHKKFQVDYKELREDLQVMQGLGEKFGAPRREMTTKIRTCYAESAGVEDFITKELEVLRELLTNGDNGVFKVITTPFQKPRSSCAAEQIFEILKGLRPKLISRAKFLHLLACNMSDSKDLPDVYFTEPEFKGYMKVAGGDNEEKQDEKEEKKKSGSKKKKKKKKAQDDVDVEEKKVEEVLFNTVITEAIAGCRSAFGKLVEAHKQMRAKEKAKKKADAADEANKKDDEKKKGKGEEKEVERELPSEGLPGPIKEMLKREEDRSKEKLLRSQQIFREQLIRLDSMLLRIPGCVFGDIMKDRCTKLTESVDEVMASFRSQYDSLERSRERHKLRMKPGLAAKENRKLDELENAESSRLVKACDFIKTIRKSILDLETKHLDCFVKNIVDTCIMMLMVFDSLLHTEDIKPDDARPPARRTMKHLLRHQARVKNSGQDAKSGEPGADGLFPRKFLVLNYSGLKFSHTALMKELSRTISDDDVAIDAIRPLQSEKTEGEGDDPAVAADGKEAEDGGAEEQDGGGTGVVASSSDIKSFKNKCNRIAYRGREAMYEEYLLGLRSRFISMLAELRLKQQEESGWSVQFRQMCDKLRKK